MIQPTKNDTPDFEIDHPEDFAQFILKGRRAVAPYLEMLAKQGSPLTAYFGNGEKHFQTRILGIDNAAESIYLYRPNEDEATKLPDSPSKNSVTLVAYLSQIKVQTRIYGIEKVQFQAQPAFLCQQPEQLLRLQRREHFRLTPSSTQPLHCQLSVPSKVSEWRHLTLQIADISGGGICLLCPSGQAADFERDTLLRECRIDIPGEGVILANLCVRKTTAPLPDDEPKDVRVGCEFVALPGTRLTMIERYIARLERERRASKSGLTT